MNQKQEMRDKPDYGIDAPGVIRNLSLAAIAIFIVAMVFPRLRVGSVVFQLRPNAWTTAPAFALGVRAPSIRMESGSYGMFTIPAKPSSLTCMTTGTTS